MARVWGNKSKGMLLALALPLAGLVAPAVPGWSAAEAATVKKTKKRKVVAVKKAPTKKVCTVTVAKRHKVKRCHTVRAVVPPPIVTTVSLRPAALAPVDPGAPAIGQPLPVVPVVMPPPPQVDAPRAVNPADYFWIDQADSLARAFGNSPPDFTFDCDGIDCWAWVSRDDEVLIVEPGREGVQQYFFAAGQSAPYLVRDSYNSFAFDGRELLVTYNNEGQVYPYALAPNTRGAAEALRERGRALYAMSLRHRRWDRGSATTWIGFYSSFGYDDGWNYGWNPFWRELPGWDGWNREHRRHRPPRHLDEEHHDRDDARRRYDDWHRRGAPGAPPPTGNPVVTPTPGATSGSEPRPGWRPRPPVPPPTAIAPGGETQPSPPASRAPHHVPPPQPEAAPAPEAGAPAPAPAPGQRRERPRREIESDPEPGAPPIPMRPAMPRPMPPEQPVPQVQAAPTPVASAPAQTWPDPMPGPAAPPPPLRVEPRTPVSQPVEQYRPPAPAPVPVPVAAPPPQYIAPAPPPSPPSPPPAPRPSPRPPESRNDSPIDGTDRP